MDRLESGKVAKMSIKTGKKRCINRSKAKFNQRKLIQKLYETRKEKITQKKTFRSLKLHVEKVVTESAVHTKTRTKLKRTNWQKLNKIHA